MYKLREEIIELLETDKEFRLTVAELLGYREILEKMENMTKSSMKYCKS